MVGGMAGLEWVNAAWDIEGWESDGLRRIWRLLLYVRPYALYSLASVVLMAVVGAMAAFRILLVKPIFDNVLSPDAPPGLVLLFRIPHTHHVINLHGFLPEHFHNGWPVLAVSLAWSASFASVF